MGIAKLLFQLKERKGNILVEIVIWNISEDYRYKNSIKYSLIAVNLVTGEKVLFDNHHPKEPHYHINDIEYGYEFVSVKVLFNDFRKIVTDLLGVKL